MGGRLQLFWRNWRLIGADDWVISVLRDGYRLPFTDVVPVTSSPPHLGYLPSHPLFQELRHQVDILIEKQAVEPVSLSTPGFYSRLFLAPKKGGEWRPVIDLSALNKFMDAPHFKMETAASIIRATVPGMWATSLDLKDAFFHIPIAPAYRKFLRFRIDDKAFQFRALPFGLTMSPFVFTKVLAPVGAYARQCGLDLHLYLDDWILLMSSAEISNQATEWLLHLALALGLIINVPKCDLTPAQIYQFLGILFDLIRGQARPTQERLDRFQLIAQPFLSNRQMSAAAWQCLLGHMTSLERLIPLARLHMRHLQFCLKEQWTAASQPPSSLITLSAPARDALLWWMVPGHLLRGISLHASPPEVRLFTDASTFGWGAHIDQDQVGGQWSAPWLGQHINILETRAVLLALQHFLHRLQGRHVIVMSDNTTVIGQIRNQGGTHSLELFHLTQELFLLADRHQITISARHIPGHLNVIADKLSRSHQILPGEWTLCPQVLNQLWHLWGAPHVDLFATTANARLPTYVSPLPELGAWRTDALSFSWTGLWAYAYPPTPLIPQVLEKVRTEECELILVAPAWPTQAWFPALLRLLIDHPRLLPARPTLLKQGPRTFHTNPQMLALHGWRLSSRPWGSRASHPQWLGESLDLTGSLRHASTTAGGTSSAAGVEITEGLIRSLPLFL